MTTIVNTRLSNILLYTCTLQEVDAGIVPTTLLPHNHPFRHLLLSHLQTLTSMGKYDSVIDAFIAVFIGDAKWRSKSSPNMIVTRRRAIRKLLIERTLKFAMVEQDISNGYGFHNRTEVFEHFIFVTKEYVDMLCGATDDSYKQLAMEAVLKATVNHELAHWLFSQRVRPFHPDYVDALDRSPTQRQEAFMQLSPRLLSENIAKHTPKDLRAGWKDEGEAGNYVEVHSQGGIISFDHDMGNAVIQTEAKVQYTLQRPYLLQFREGHSIRFVPPQFIPQYATQASLQRRKAGMTFFPHVDTCYHPMPQSFHPGVGLGLTVIKRSSGCAWRLNTRKMVAEFLSRKKEESVVE